MFVVNQIDLITEIKNKNNINNIMRQFSQEINDIYKKIINNDWNKQLNYSEIIQKSNGLLFSYFSNKYYRENKIKYKTLNLHFNNIKELIKYIIESYSLNNSKPETIIKGLSKYIKKDYLNKLKNKKYYNSNEIKYIDSDYRNACDILQNYNINDGDIKKNKDEIIEIIKKYIFIKKNLDKYEYNYNFEDFFSILTNKIKERNVIPKNSIILKFINELNINSTRTKENLIKYELNLKVEFHEVKELKIIYNEFVKKIEENVKENEKILNNIVEKIINEKYNFKYYEKFKIQINDCFSFLNETAKKYSKKISNCSREIILKYKIKYIYINEYLISIDFSDIITNEHYLKICASLISFGTLVLSFGEPLLLYSSFLVSTCSVGIATIVGYRIVKYLHNKKRENIIIQQFETYFDKLNFIKKKILNNMESLYNEALNDIRNYKISQKEPLINIYINNKKLEKIQNEFLNICNKIQNNN